MNGLREWVAAVHPASAGGTWSAINRGGSDRQFWRGGGAAAGLVAVVYGTEKTENAVYAACAEFLRARGVSVPSVLAHDSARRFLLLEDAGAEDLWSQRDEPWPGRRALYVAALQEAARMHALPLAEAEAAGLLQAPFDEALYAWEQEYFREHFLGRAFHPDEQRVLSAQARALASRPRVLLHRDFQSQNIILRSGGVCLVDFQGMRAGLAGYDVASLLFDPYVEMEPDQRTELADTYAELAGRTDAAAWESELRACARQRLMQALGAYGFLGRVKGRTHFLRHIPVAAERLAELCGGEDGWDRLGERIREAAVGD